MNWVEVEMSALRAVQASADPDAWLRGEAFSTPCEHRWRTKVRTIFMQSDGTAGREFDSQCLRCRAEA